MKKFQKITLMLSLGLAIMGGILLGTGYVLGAFNYPSESWNFSIGRHAGEAKDISESYQEVVSLDFELGHCEATIQEGEQFSIEAQGVAADFQSYVKDGVWHINSKSSLMKVNERLLKLISEDKSINGGTLVITIPTGAALEKADIEIGMGVLEAQNITARELDVSIGAGEGKMSQIFAERAELDCGMGSLQYAGSIQQEASISCGMGDIIMELDGTEDSYNYEVDCGMGDVVIGGQSYAGVSVHKKEDQNHENSKSDMEIECGMGKVEVQFSHS